MRYKIIISIQNLRLNTYESKKLLKIIQGINGLDGIVLKTGLEYDSNIEDDGDDSEMIFTEIDFYADGNEETATIIANEAISLVIKSHKISLNSFCITLTETENIIFLF